MKKTSMLLQKLAIGISFFLMVIITIPTIFYITDDFTYLQKIADKPYLIVWTISLTLAIFFYQCFRFINRMNEKKAQMAAVIVSVVMVGLQLIVLFGLDTLIKSFTIDETKIKSHWITLSFKNRLVPNPDEKYELVITPKQPGESDSIIFTHHFSDAYDEYKGNAIVNGEVKPYDFLLQVNNKYEAAPLSINVYFLFVGILIALCLLNIGWGVLENLNMTQTSEENV